MTTRQVSSARWARHALINRLQSLLLMAFLGGYLVLLGWLIWGEQAMVWLLLAGVLFLLFGPAVTPQVVMRLYRARALAPAEVPPLYRMVAQLGERAGLEHLPQLYYIPSRMVNAFAVGTRRHAGIGLTDGLLRALDRRELAAVLAHELSHIRSNDIRVMTLADLANRLTSALSLVGQVLLLINLPLILLSLATVNWWAVLALVFAPQLSALAQLGLSRVREYEADLNAARLTGDPQALARALHKLEMGQPYWWGILLPGYRLPEPSLLRTHPPTEERVRRLLVLARELAGSAGAREEAGTAPLFGERQAVRRPRWHITGLWH